jgi:hypothetical protein
LVELPQVIDFCPQALHMSGQHPVPSTLVAFSHLGKSLPGITGIGFQEAYSKYLHMTTFPGIASIKQ